MRTVFSHIIQKRFSQASEDVATDSLAFILGSSMPAQKGMMKILRGITPDMPNLRFQTQQVEGNIRPDMWGYDDNGPRVYVENKFWAGLTDNQPVSYLKQLESYVQPTVLLVVAPEARQETIKRELSRRLKDAGIIAKDSGIVAGSIAWSVITGKGQTLALTSWTKVLSALELEASDDKAVLSDLLQLRALCEAADNDAFLPISTEEITDQRIPAFIIQLSTIVQDAVDLAVTEGTLNIGGLRPQASWDRIGRYTRFSDERGAGAWIGTNLSLWKEYGGTPLWVSFLESEFGRSQEVRKILEPWAAREGVLTDFREGEFVVAIDMVLGEDKSRVVRSIADRLKEIAETLSPMNKK